MHGTSTGSTQGCCFAYPHATRSLSIQQTKISCIKCVFITWDQVIVYVIRRDIRALREPPEIPDWITAVSGHMTSLSILQTRFTNCSITADGPFNLISSEPWPLKKGLLIDKLQNFRHVLNYLGISIKRFEGCAQRWTYNLILTIGSSNGRLQQNVRPRTWKKLCYMPKR